MQAILDAPDGNWTVDVKNDIFDKVAGSVRSTQLVKNASYYVKQYVAVASVLAEMDLEERLLTVRVNKRGKKVRKCVEVWGRCATRQELCFATLGRQACLLMVGACKCDGV